MPTKLVRLQTTLMEGAMAIIRRGEEARALAFFLAGGQTHAFPVDGFAVEEEAEWYLALCPAREPLFRQAMAKAAGLHLARKAAIRAFLELAYAADNLEPKDIAVTRIRAAAQQINAEAVVLIQEAWAAPAATEGEVRVRPSHHAQRQEILSVQLETRTHWRTAIVNIHRRVPGEPASGLLSLGQPRISEGPLDEAHGRFTRLLGQSPATHH